MNPDTIAIIVSILGVGLALWRSIAAMEGRVNSRIDAMNNSFNNRIDNLYQALFSHKDPAA